MADEKAQNRDTPSRAGDKTLAIFELTRPSSIANSTLADELKKQISEDAPAVSVLDIFRYASSRDWLVLGASTIASIAAGAVQPSFPLIFGNMATLFQQISLGRIPKDDFDRELTSKSLTLVYLGIGCFFATYISAAGFMSSGERLTRKIRQQYFRALLKQNIAFFDATGPGALSSRISLDCQTIQEGISEKVAFTISSLSMLVTAYIIGFIRSWRLTLVASAVFVVMIAVSAVSTRFIAGYMIQSMGCYSTAGSLAEEAISSVRTVKVLGAQEGIATKFDDQLTVVERWARKAQIAVAILIAIALSMTFMSHSLNFWAGSIFVVQGHTTIGDVITVAFAILVAAHSFGGVAPHFRAFGSAMAAASKVYAVIDRASPLDPTSEAGHKLQSVSGNIQFQDVKHVYPSRPEQVVLDGSNISIPAGKTTAIVGASGSGKSTIIALIERFYSPVGGQILCDGHDIASLNLKWFRQRIGLVGQEPVLFGSTIFDNIVMGLFDEEDNDQDPEKTELLESRVHHAAKLANAHDFVMSLPDGYNTKIGQGGSQLSGGQKQRIAIARALIRDPAILLLDEATSALDTESEYAVKEAIRTASIGRTALIVSHRLSAVVEADNIIVLAAGQIVEQGTHEQLKGLHGTYAELLQAQQLDLTTQEPSREDKGSFDAATPGTHDKLTLPTDDKILSANDDSVQSKSSTNKPSLWTLICLTASFNRPEAVLMYVGLAFSVLAGCGGPALAFLLAKSISAISQPDSDSSSLRSAANYWSLWMFVTGLVQLFNLLVKALAFAVCSERLVYRARSTLFRTLLAKDAAFFERDENKTGALTPLLGVEAKNLAGVSGSTLGTISMSCTTLVASVIIALAIAWKLSLVCIATMPVLLGCGFYRVWMLAKFAERSHSAHQVSTAYASEIITCARTVASLAVEREAADRYEKQERDLEKASMASIWKSSVPYAASQSFSFFCIALVFWYGGERIAAGEYSIFQFFLCFAEIIFGTQTAGVVFSFATDIGQAKKAAGTFYKLLCKEPTIEGGDLTQNSIKMPVTGCQGKVEFCDVKFAYPTRPNVQVLNGLNFTVQPGQSVALVGSSGCGKSTCFALLERLYDPHHGTVELDGSDIRGLDVHGYRSTMAYVSQEPTLFSGTIRDNITLGHQAIGNIDDKRILQSCDEANIKDFILSLPDGLSTVVGSRGVLLSGGQKQRVAIARALIREPKILLLDEATSALDSGSEKLVQDALEKAARGRTTITVAHRLSSIQNSDKICVVEAGQVVEEGTHFELMNRRGKYYALASVQASRGIKENI